MSSVSVNAVHPAPRRRKTYSVRSLMVFVALICSVLAVASTLYQAAARQRRCLSILVSHFDNQPWISVRYRGLTQREEPLERWFLFDAFVPLDAIELFGTTVPETDAGLEGIASDTSITVLILRDTGVSERGFAAIAKFRRLRELTITHTDLSAKSMSAILSMPSLRRLRLKACRKEYEDDAMPEPRAGLDVVWE